MRPMLACQVQLELFHTTKFLKHTDCSTQNSTLFHTLSHLYYNSVASSNTIIRNIFTSHHSNVQPSHFHTTLICLLLIQQTDRQLLAQTRNMVGVSNSLLTSPTVEKQRKRHVSVYDGLGSYGSAKVRHKRKPKTSRLESLKIKTVYFHQRYELLNTNAFIMSSV